MGESSKPLINQQHQPHQPSPSKERAEYAELMFKVAAALFYGVSSFMIMVVNKRVLTVYKFPSFQVLGLGQVPG